MLAALEVKRKTDKLFSFSKIFIIFDFIFLSFGKMSFFSVFFCPPINELHCWCAMHKLVSYLQSHFT